MDHSVLLPFVPRKAEQVLPYAALVESGRARRLWQGHSVHVDALHGFAAAAGAGFRVPTGLGVALMPLRHPFDAAHQVRSLAMVTGQPVVAGFGPGSTAFQECVLGTRYRSPLTACREYLAIVRALLAGGPVDVEGEYHSCRAEMVPAAAPPVEVGLGVLRPGMARLAGEVADVAVTWLTPASYLREVVVPALAEGAAAAGRPRPRLTAIVPVALTRPYHEPAEMLVAGNRIHLQAPHYADMLRRSGVEVAGDDLVLTAKRAVEAGALVHGDLDEALAQVAEFAAAGVDELVVNLTAVSTVHGPREALDDGKKILTALEGAR